MIKVDYYEENICQECCEKYKTDECIRKFCTEKDKKEKVTTMKCQNYKRKIEEEI